MRGGWVGAGSCVGRWMCVGGRVRVCACAPVRAAGNCFAAYATCGTMRSHRTPRARAREGVSKLDYGSTCRKGHHRLHATTCVDAHYKNKASRWMVHADERVKATKERKNEGSTVLAEIAESKEGRIAYCRWQTRDIEPGKNFLRQYWACCASSLPSS